MLCELGGPVTVRLLIALCGLVFVIEISLRASWIITLHCNTNCYHTYYLLGFQTSTLLLLSYVQVPLRQYNYCSKSERE